MRTVAHVMLAGFAFLSATAAHAVLLVRTVTFSAIYPPTSVQPALTGSFTFTSDAATPAIPLGLTAIDLTIASHTYLLSEVGIGGLDPQFPADPGLYIYGLLNGKQVNQFTQDFSFTLQSIAPNAISNASLNYAAPNQSGVVFPIGRVVAVITPAGAVPEPATWALMLVGFGGVGYSMRRSRKVAVRFP